MMPEDGSGRPRAGVGHLLAGEHADSAEPSVAAHWAGVYAELVQTKTRLIAALLRLMKPQSRPARAELSSTDVAFLNRELRQLKRRRRFWRGKRQLPSHKTLTT